MITLNEYRAYIAQLDATSNTSKTYARNLRQFFVFIEKSKITAPERTDILDFKEFMLSKNKPSTAQNYLISVHLFFKWTEKEGIYPNIASDIKSVKLDDGHKKEYLTVSQIKNVINDVDTSTDIGLRDYTMLVLMVIGGLRTIEVSRAKIEDLRTVGSSPVLFLQGKGRNERTEYIRLPEDVEKLIRTYLKTRKRPKSQEPLFISMSNNSYGQELTTRSISGIIKNILQQAGYNSDKLTAHSLRHTAVTIALTSGKSITEVQQFARHKNINTTQIYNHSLDTIKNSCSSAIAKLILDDEYK